MDVTIASTYQGSGDPSQGSMTGDENRRYMEKGSNKNITGILPTLQNCVFETIFVINI